MLVDILSCIPFQLLSSAFGGNFGGNYLKLLRLSRLIRIRRSIQVQRRFIQYFSKKIKKIVDFFRKYSGFLRLFKSIIYAFLMIHLMSCLWHLVAKLADYNPGTWVARGGYEDDNASYKYLLSVYWALQTLTTVGFGDITAKTNAELYITIFWMIFGVIFYSITVSNLTSIIFSLDVAESRTQAYLNNLHKFSLRVNLPEETKQKVRKFIEANSKNSDNAEYQDALLKDLPSSLKTEVISHTHGEIIRRIIFFRDKDLAFLWKVMPMLKPLRVLIDDIIYNQQEKAKEMYFIIKGRVKLWYNLAHKDMMQDVYKGFNQYVEGSYFGDVDLICGTHDSVAIPTSEVNLLVLSKLNITRIINKMPKEMKSFIKLAKEREKYHRSLVVRSLQKDKEAYKLFKLTQKLEEIDPNSPAQFVVKLLRTYLEKKSKQTTFEQRLYRMISKSPVCELDSDDGMLKDIDNETFLDSSSSHSSSGSETGSSSSESEESKSSTIVTESICKNPFV